VDEQKSLVERVKEDVAQRYAALKAWYRLVQARAEVMKAPPLIGPGRRSVHTLHRKIRKGQKYGPHNTRPYSHPRREARFKAMKEAAQFHE
jgi:hypothetical protein